MTDEITEGRGCEPRELQNPGIIEAFAAGVMAFGQEAVRRRLRKGKTSLYGEMNPNGDQRKAKLSVDDAIEATRITGDVTWLAMLAAELGYSLVPADDVKPDRGTVAEECTDDMIGLGAFTRVVNDPGATVLEVRRAGMEVCRNIRETETLKIREICKGLK